MSFSNPCPDFLTPLLQECGTRESCGTWEGACKLAQISQLWRAATQEWRALVIDIFLDRRADFAALYAIATSCTRLQFLSIRRWNRSALMLAGGLTEIAKTSPSLTQLTLSHSNTASEGGKAERRKAAVRPKRMKCFSFYEDPWTKHWASLELLDLSETCAIRDRDFAVLIARLRNLKALNLQGVELESVTTLRLFVEQQSSVLESLNLSDVTFEPHDDQLFYFNECLALLLVQNVTTCTNLRELHLRSLGINDHSLVGIFTSCRRIEVLNLFETNVCTASLKPLANMPVLKQLCICSTPLSRASMGELETVDDVWPEVGAILRRIRKTWAYLDFQRHPGNKKWYGPTSDKRSLIPISGFDYRVGRFASNSLQIGDNWCARSALFQ